MDPLKQTTEHHIPLQDVQGQHKKITKEQERILFQVSLANVLLFGAGTLNPEQQQLQDHLQQEYLQSLKPGDTVDILLTGAMGGDIGTVIANDGNTIKIQILCNGNESEDNGIGTFSTKNGYLIGSFLGIDSSDDDYVLYIDIPQQYTVTSTAGIPKEALDELSEIYKQAGDEKTCYDLVNTLKYGTSPDDIDDFIF